MPLRLFVMNGRSSWAIVLGYSFLAEQQATINFGSKEMNMGGAAVRYLSKEMKGEFVAVKKNIIMPRNVQKKYAMDAQGTQQIVTGSKAFIQLRWKGDDFIGA